MKLFFVVLAAIVIAANAECTFKFDYACSAGDACDLLPTSDSWKICADDSTTCINSVCTADPVLGGACSITSTPCYDEDFLQSACLNSVCTAVYYKDGDAACTSSTECISQACVASKCTVTPAGATCVSDRLCVGGKFCQSSSTTSLNTCEDLKASGADCFKPTDSCQNGQTCTAKLTGLTFTAGKCVDWWSVAKGGQCSAGGQCSDGLWCDSDATSATYQTCIDPVTATGTCSLGVGCAANPNIYCDVEECVCKAHKEESSSDVSSAAKDFLDCLDANKCHATNANSGGCGAQCLDKAKDVNSALDEGESASLRGWSFANEKDPCDDSAAIASVSFFFVAAMALLAL